MTAPNRYLLCFVVLILFLLSLTGCGQQHTSPAQSQPVLIQANAPYPLTITNYDQQENLVSYTYEKAPEKVILTHPGATELLLELGLDHRILSTVPPYGPPLARLADRYKALTIMNTPYAPSQEELLEMQPHMIIGWVHQFSSHAIGDVSTWNKRSIATFIMPSTLTKSQPTLENTVYAPISDLGKIFNIQSKTDLYVEQIKKRVSAVEDSVKDVQHKKTVLVLQDHGNGTFSLYDTHYLISHLITIAGGKNICEYPASLVGAEQVLAFDPDFILFVTLGANDNTKDSTDEEAVHYLKGVKELQSMRAIRQGNIINLPFFTVNNGGIRTIDAMEKIAQTLYPENFNANSNLLDNSSNPILK